MTGPHSTRWFYLPRPRVAPEVRLFCFPGAGSDGTTFAGLVRHLPEQVELLGLRMPGRAGRAAEPGPTTFEELRSLVTDALLPFADVPYVLLGHSMGALVALEVAQWACRDPRPATSRLLQACVVIACSPPHVWRESPAASMHEDIAAFHRAVDNGVLEAVAEDPGLREFLIKPLLADLALCDRFPWPTRLAVPVPIHAVAGSADSAADAWDMAAWRDCTSAGFSLDVVSAAHMVIRDATAETGRSVTGFLRRLGLVAGGLSVPAGKLAGA